MVRRPGVRVGECTDMIALQSVLFETSLGDIIVRLSPPKFNSLANRPRNVAGGSRDDTLSQNVTQLPQAL